MMIRVSTHDHHGHMVYNAWGAQCVKCGQLWNIDTSGKTPRLVIANYLGAHRSEQVRIADTP